MADSRRFFQHHAPLVTRRRCEALKASRTVDAPSEKAARRALRAFADELGADPGRSSTFGGLLEAYFAATCSGRTARSNEEVRRVIDADLASAHDWPLASVSVARLEQLYGRIRAQPGRRKGDHQVRRNRPPRPLRRIADLSNIVVGIQPRASGVSAIKEDHTTAKAAYNVARVALG